LAQPVGSTARLQSFSLALVTAIAVLAVLVYGRGFLVPLVIAFLLTSLILSAVQRLEIIGAPTWLAMVCTIGVSFLVLFAVFMILYSQTDAIAEAWPRYVEKFNQMLASLMAWAGPEIVERARTGFSRVDIAGSVQNFADSAGGFLGGIGLVIMYTAFLLAERGGMSSKFVRLVSDPERSSELHGVFETVVQGIRQYLSIKTLTSLMTSGLCYLVLRLYGVDFAEIWGLLIFLLNFIPSIGSIVAVIIPSMFSVAQFGTIWPALQIAALMSVVQFVIGNVVEPKYMGRTLNLSPFVVILSLTFWGTIWGAVGMFLSVPIAATIVIVCRNIPSWRWVAVLMSADGRPEPSDENENQAEGGKRASYQFRWPFGPSKAEREELAALRSELDALKSERAAAGGQKPGSSDNVSEVEA
jgi:AI-2 transport protein TqsA